jgi:uncharacterized damage-inducible protein DinB
MPIEPPECSRLFQDLETQRTDLLAELSEWPPSRVSFRPSPGAWSAIEVLDHIVKAEAGTIADIRTGLQNPHNIGDEARPNIAALDRALRTDQRFQVPLQAVAIHPDSQTTFQDVASRWEQVRAELKSLLESLEPAATRCGVFQHPFAGWMTIADVLNHFSAHLHHHGFQIARLREASAV